MTDPVPPDQVIKRDGRREPFASDKISRALFAASEELGQPDAFLARELADGVVHFLSGESFLQNGTPTTAEIEEVVIKVVRELGHPALAATFSAGAERRRQEAEDLGFAQVNEEEADESHLTIQHPAQAPLEEVLAACARAYSLQKVFTRDLVAVTEAGLMVLGGLENPDRLAGCVVAFASGSTGPSPPRAIDLLADIGETGRLAGEFVVLDGLEYWLARSAEAEHPQTVAQALAQSSLTCPGRRVVVNLNCSQPPPWAVDQAEGPLFAGPRSEGSPAGPPFRAHLAERADALLEGLLPKAGVRVDWHLSETDFAPPQRERLLRVCRRALAEKPWVTEAEHLTFVLDRGTGRSRSVALAEGITRKHPALLMQVGLNLPELARKTDDSEQFLQRLGSLARLASSAAVQKRDYLRRRARQGGTGAPVPRTAPGLTSGFLLDRARLMVTPLGLGEVIAHFTGLDPECVTTWNSTVLALARKVLIRLRNVLQQEGRATLLDTCLDGPCHFSLAGPFPSASLEQQGKIGNVLHSATEHGTVTLLLPEGPSCTPEHLADCLHTLWEQTEIVRVRFR